MHRIKQNVVSGLQNARQALLAIPKEMLSYSTLAGWYRNHLDALKKADGLGAVITINFPRYVEGYQSETDVEVFAELRDKTTGLVDRGITQVNAQIKVKPILEEWILKVSNTKLATLLKEFNNSREVNPNLAAMGFRTILTLIIQERAKRVNPTSKLAAKEDLQLEPDLKAAISEGIFNEAETKLLRRFLNGGDKDTFDNVVHKNGVNTLVEKDRLEDSVELLNSLLPTISD